MNKNLTTITILASLLLTACGGGGGGGGGSAPSGINFRNITISPENGTTEGQSFSTLWGSNYVTTSNDANSFNNQNNSTNNNVEVTMKSDEDPDTRMFMWTEITIDGQKYEIKDTNGQIINGVEVSVNGGGGSDQLFEYTDQNNNRTISGEVRSSSTAYKTKDTLDREFTGFTRADYMATAYWEEIDGTLAHEATYDNKLVNVNHMVVGSYTPPDVVSAKTGQAEYYARMDGMIKDSLGRNHIDLLDGEYRTGRVEQAGYASGFTAAGSINMNFDTNSFSGKLDGSNILADTAAIYQRDYLGNEVYRMPTGIEITNGSITANRVNANLIARDVSVTGVAGTTDMNGTMQGYFFGPQAQELGGTWSMNGGGHNAMGVIAGSTRSDID